MPSVTYIILASSLFSMGTGLAIWGKHGCRIDRHPICRKCGYDLHGGSIERGTQCPECGRGLGKRRSVKIGNRQLSRKCFWPGVILILVGFSCGIDIGISASRAYNWYQAAPVWLILDFAEDDSNASRAADARNELLRRQYHDKLWEYQYRKVIDSILLRQADRSRPWDYQWGDFFEIARSKGYVNDAQWRQFLTESVQTGMAIKPVLETGEDFYIEFHRIGKYRSANLRDVNTEFVAGVQLPSGEITNPDEEHAVEFYFKGVTTQNTLYEATYRDLFIWVDLHPELVRISVNPNLRFPPGDYVCNVTIHWYVYDTLTGLPGDRSPTDYYSEPFTNPVSYSVDFKVLSKEKHGLENIPLPTGQSQ